MVFSKYSPAARHSLRSDENRNSYDVIRRISDFQMGSKLKGTWVIQEESFALAMLEEKAGVARRLFSL